MSSKDQELEVKLYVSDLPALETRLRALGAALVQSRTHEVNLRFDTLQGELTRTQRVLRLRQDTAARVTYKGPSLSRGGARLRQEYEFVVSDYQSARNLFEALGYQVSMMYEKFRTTYELDGVQVVLDEMPYGNFLEIEGPDPLSIQAISDKLALNWEERIMDSYTVIFDRLCSALKLPFRDLSFANFKEQDISLAVLGIHPADV